MANAIERYFGEALARLPSQPPLTNNPPPIPEFSEHQEADAWGTNDNDWVEPLSNRELEDKMKRRLGDFEPPMFPLSDDDRGLIDGGIRENGFEVLAFYKSHRDISKAPYPGKWGVFYIEHGVTRVQELIELTYPGYGPSKAMAYEFLRQHERFHLKFDIYALSVEAALGRHLYEPLKQAFSRYRIYQVEEALANRNTWEWTKQPRVGLEEFAYDFMKLQPGAYSRFDEDKSALASELAANLLDLKIGVGARRNDQAPWVAHVPDTLLRRSLCPEYVVRPANLYTWISPAVRLPVVKEVRDCQQVIDLLTTKYQNIRERWEATKQKLSADSGLPSLNFKSWDKAAGYWSVRINDNFRAHLKQLSNGIWQTEEIGPHKAMGHG